MSLTEHDILSIIRSLNSNKAHGWNDISTCMVKICDKKVHKKESKSVFKNYDQYHYYLSVVRYLKVYL